MWLSLEHPHMQIKIVARTSTAAEVPYPEAYRDDTMETCVDIGSDGTDTDIRHFLQVLHPPCTLSTQLNAQRARTDKIYVNKLYGNHVPSEQCSHTIRIVLIKVSGHVIFHF